jgi:RNA polymerase sigma-70 factor (ECF subfamily)
MGNVGLADLEIRISSLENSILDNILVSEAESIISKTLSTFSDQTQNIFHLSRIDGLSNAEIASKIGLSEKGVEYHISKVLKTLRISLKDFLFFLILISLGRSFFQYVLYYR